MPIIGINKEKCTNCGLCIDECPTLCFIKNDTGQVIYEDQTSSCLNCGHCIAICHTNAILHENLGECEEYATRSTAPQLNYPEFLQLISRRRSIRQYKRDPVPKDLIEKVLIAMKYAPCSHNERNWSYVLMSDPAKIKDLGANITQDIIKHPIWGQVFGESAKKYTKSNRDLIFLNAPVIIFLSTNTETPLEGNNAGIALTIGMLAAETLGLGTCWLGIAQIGLQINPDLKKKVGIRGTVWGVISLGFPDVKYYRTAPRNPVKMKEAK